MTLKVVPILKEYLCMIFSLMCLMVHYLCDNHGSGMLYVYVLFMGLWVNWCHSCKARHIYIYIYCIYNGFFCFKLRLDLITKDLTLLLHVKILVSIVEQSTTLKDWLNLVLVSCNFLDAMSYCRYIVMFFVWEVMYRKIW